jgi:hypothetical protein
MMRRDARFVMLVAALMLATAGALTAMILRGPDIDPRHKFELERPSAWLAERAPERLVMFWDGPNAEASPEFTLAGVGGYFLRRDGHPVDVTVARAAKSDDPNLRVLSRVPQGVPTAILWFANDKLPDNRKPRIEQYDARFECHDFGGSALTMTACRLR